MQKIALRLATVDGHPPRSTKEKVQERLRMKGIRGLKTARLSTLAREDLNKVLYVGRGRKADPLLIFPISSARKLFPGLRRREAPVRFSTLRGMGITFDKTFDDRMIDTFAVLYCGEEVAIVASASRLLEFLR